MASLDDVLKGNLRGYRRETGQPAEEIAVEEPAIDEVEPPQLYDERAEYRGFKVPAGMDADQTERWFGAIDSREDEREAAEAEAEAEFEAESGFMTQFTGSLERTVMKDNPRMGAKAVEGLGRVAGSQAMIDFGSKTAAEYDTSDDPAAFSPRIESIYDAEGFQDYIDYAGSTLGQGVASIGTMVAGGAAGAAAGAPLGLSAVTAPVGAFTAGFIQNYGDLYDTLVDQEGMDPDDAAKYALIPAGIMGALDTTGVIKIVKPARDGLSKNLVKRTAQLAIRGGGNEAVTEAAQQVVQESAGEIAEVTGLATKDIEFSQRFENVVNALIAGFIPGFTLGGASAVRVRPEDDAPAPPAPTAPPATPSVSPVVDPGGSVTELFPQRNTLERATKIGVDVPDWLKGASGSELLDRPVGVPKDFNDPGFIRMIESPAHGYDSDYLYQLNQYVTTRRNVLKRDYDEELRKAFEGYPEVISVGNIDNAEKIKLQLEQFSRGYDESANSMSGPYLVRFARKVDGVQVDLTPIESSVGLSTEIVGFANKLEGALLDDLTTPEFMRNPVLQNIKLGFDSVVKEFPEGSRREGFRALEAMFDDYQDLDKARQLMPVGFSDDHNKKRFLNKFMNEYFRLDAPKPEEIVSANMEEVTPQPVRVTAALTGVQDARPDLSRMKNQYLTLSQKIAEAEQKDEDATSLKVDLNGLEQAIFGDFESSLRDILGRDGDIEIARFDRGIGGWAGQSLEPNLRVELVGDEAKILSRLTEFNATSGMSGPNVVPQGGALNRVFVEALSDEPDVIDSYDPNNVEQNKQFVWDDNGAERLATLRIQLPPEMVTPQFLASLHETFAKDQLGFTVDRDNSTIELVHAPEWNQTDAQKTLTQFVDAARSLRKVAKDRFGKDIAIEWLKERIEISQPTSGVENVKNAFTEGESRYILKGYQELLKDEYRERDRSDIRDRAPDGERKSGADAKDQVKPKARKRGVSVEATNDAVSEAAASNRSLSNLPTYEQFVFGGDEREGSFGLDRLHERAEQARSKVDDDVSRALMSRMGLQFEDRDTSAELKIYPLQDKFGSTLAEVIGRLKEWTDTEGTVADGWTFTVFGPSFDKTGKILGFIKPDFKNNGYAQKNAYIYQPNDPNGAFDDVAYTYAWRATHEIAHGLVNDKLTEQYGGQGRRAGALGILARDDSGRQIMDPLSLSDALRALDWEHETFLKQREILEQDLGVSISEDQFNREYMLNMSDAVHRVLTGRFSNPGELGAVPINEDPAVVLERAKDTVRQAASAMGMDMSERADGPQEIVTPQTSEGQQYVGLGGLSVEEAIDASKSISTGVELAEFIIENAENKDYKEIAKRLIPHLEETDVHTLTGDVNDLPQWVFESEKQGTLSRNIVNSLAGMSAHHTRLRYAINTRLRYAIKGLNISRPGDPYNDVFIRGRPVYSGATAETMLHELIHAATVRRQADGNLAANEGTKLQKAASKIIQLRNDVVQVAKKAQQDGSLDSDMESILVRATEDDKEFIAYGMTNKKFQEFLMTIKSKNKSIWNRFVEAVAGLLGINKDNQTALSDLILATDELLSAPLDEVPLRQMTESIEMMSQPAEDALPEDVEKKLNEAAEAGTITREEAMEARREWRNKGTDSSFFKKWFRDSVVVDSNGKPLRVLHGTASKFDVFSISGDRVGLLGQGVYTSLNEGVANYYASPVRNRGKEIVGPPDAEYPVMGNVIPGYVSIQNPVFTQDPLDKKVVEEMKEWIETRRKGTIDVSSETGTISYFELLAQIEDIAYRGSGNYNVNRIGMQRALVKILKSNGYDGVINTNRDEFDKLQKNDFEDAPSNMHIVVLEPNQFKSDIGNLGTFSLVDDEIFFQREEIPGAATAGDKEEGNPAEELGPVILSQRVDSPVDTVVIYTDDVSRSKAELDRRREIRNKYEPLLFELMKLESEFYEKDDRSEEVKKLGYQYEDLLKQYAQIDDELFADEYDRFLKGGDFYYETMEEGLEDFDVDRGFEVMSGAPDIMMDIELRSTQEEMQRKRFDRMMERGGTLVDLAGKNSPINRLILQKAKTFNHPVQTVQLIESDKVQLQEDLNNVEELKEDGLISYLLYKELKGDVMLF